jgi:hypothetical protein
VSPSPGGTLALRPLRSLRRPGLASASAKRALRRHLRRQLRSHSQAVLSSEGRDGGRRRRRVTFPAAAKGLAAKGLAAKGLAAKGLAAKGLAAKKAAKLRRQERLRADS